MENPENLSSEELALKKEEMLQFYKESMPYLEAQFEYEKMLSTMNNLTVSYAFCVSKFLQDKFDSDQVKYKIIKEIMIEDDIKIFYGDDENYFDCLYDNYITSN